MEGKKQFRPDFDLRLMDQVCHVLIQVDREAAKQNTE